MKTSQLDRAAARLEQISNNRSAQECAAVALREAAESTRAVAGTYDELRWKVENLPGSAARRLENKLASVAGEAVRAVLAAENKVGRLTKQADWLATFLSKADFDRFVGEFGLAVESAVKAARKWWQSSGLVVRTTKLTATADTAGLGMVRLWVLPESVELVERAGKEVLIADIVITTDKVRVELLAIELNAGKVRRAAIDRLRGEK